MDQPTIEGERSVQVSAGARSRSARLYRASAIGAFTLASVLLAWWSLTRVGSTAAASPGPATARVRNTAPQALPPLDVGSMRPPTTAAGAAEPESPKAEAAVASDAPAVERAAAGPSRGARTSPVLLHAGTTSNEARGPTTPVAPWMAATPAALDPTAWTTGLLAASTGTPVSHAADGVPSVLRHRRWLLPKGSFLDCTLETAIDSSLPGMTTCVLAEDAYGADGRVVLLERGTHLIGEAKSEVRPGQNRVAVEWTDARTPAGIAVPLLSAGTDSLGRAGVPGSVDRHLRERFGAAVLLTFIDAAANAVATRQQGGAAIIYNPQATKDIASEALRASIGIPPTIRVAPGARLQVIVAADVDFAEVYRLESRDDTRP
jgi:type IV secretion system protein VirB10